MFIRVDREPRWRRGIQFIDAIASCFHFHEGEDPKAGRNDVDLVVTRPIVSLLHSISVKTEIVNRYLLAVSSHRTAFGSIMLLHFCSESG